MSSEEFPEFEKIFEEFLQRKANMEKRNKELAEEKIVINQNLREKDKPMLIVKNAVYPGVILEFPTSRFEITTEKRQVMIFEDFKIIKFRPL